MIENVGGLGPLRGPVAPGPAPKSASVEGERSFKEILQDSLSSVNQLQKDADQVLEKYTKGQATQDQVMVAFKKAQIAFEAMLQIRNKLVDAFEEIQRMRV
jgi:flagellar hook-basal body complex protein FliE